MLPCKRLMPVAGPGSFARSSRSGSGRVQVKTDIRNHRSQRAIAGIGATYEGVRRRYQRRDDGTVRDTVLFSVTAEGWPGARTLLERRLGVASSVKNSDSLATARGLCLL